ncbi:hypothetical protein COCON_G00157870 [Conger conger]|uniref:THD domain-containing protein n=1 Tax=Conger conger TaxID=82655 RepID=A0A9Q1DA49_CONCO|nr:hypothetical protein COCON_G00157870 [Conger conger]
MVHETFMNRARLFVVVFTLLAIVVATGIFFSKHEEPACPNPNRSVELTGAELSNFFQVPNSTASIFLAAINSTGTGNKKGTLLWEEENVYPNNMHLDKGRTKIVVEKRGFYLVFVQATFKVPSQHRESLMLRVDVQHPEHPEHPDHDCGIFFLFLQTHSSLDCKHNKNDLEHSTSAHYQPEIESRPNAHLTALNCSMQNTEYLEWETRKGDAHLHMFNYSNKALIAPQDGNYSIYLQITYRMYEDYHCNPRNLLQLKQEVFHRSDRYPDQTVLMMALDSINCSEKTWRKSLYMSRVFSLEKGDQLKVKVGHLKLIDCNEKKVFFGAFLI